MCWATGGENTLLNGHVKVHGVRILASGANVHWNQARKVEVRVRQDGHELLRSDKPCTQRITIPKNKGIGAEIRAIDGNGEGYAIDRHTGRIQLGYRGRSRDADDRVRIMISSWISSASEDEHAGKQKNKVPHKVPPAGFDEG